MKIERTRAEVHATLEAQSGDKAVRGNLPGIEHSRAYFRPAAISADYRWVDGRWALHYVIVRGKNTQQWAVGATPGTVRAQWSETGLLNGKVVGSQHLANAPQWVRDFVEENRPGGTK